MNQPIQKCKILTSNFFFFRIDQTMGVSSSQKNKGTLNENDETG